MIRLLALSLAGFALAPFAGAQAPKKPPGKLPEFAVEVAKIRKGVDAKLAPISAAVEKDYEAAKTEGDREAIVAKSRAESEKIRAPAHAQAMKLLLPNAADPAAAAGLVWVGSSNDLSLQTEAVTLLRKHHLVRPETLAFAKDNKQTAYAWVEGLLRAQFAAADLPADQRWRVQLALAMCLQNLAAVPTLIADNPGQVESVYGS